MLTRDEEDNSLKISGFSFDIFRNPSPENKSLAQLLSSLVLFLFLHFNCNVFLHSMFQFLIFKFLFQH